jgi:hypothetical protein
MLIPYLGFPESDNLSHYHLLQYFDQIICNFDIKKAVSFDPAFPSMVSIMGYQNRKTGFTSEAFS